MLETVFVYSGIFLLTIFCSFLSTKKDRFIYIFISIVIVAIISGFRDYSVGIDTLTYTRVFSSINGTLDTSRYVYVPDMEDSFIVFVRVLLFFSGGSFQFLFCVIAFVIHFFFIRRFWELRHQLSFPLSVFLYIIAFLFSSLNIMRQLCAVALVFWSTRFIGSKNYLLFSLFVLLAMCFHTSAVLAFLYLAFELFRWHELEPKQKNILVILVVLSSFVMPLAFVFFAERYIHYLGTPSVDIGFLLPTKVLFYAFLLYYLHKTTINYEHMPNHIHISQITIYVVCGLILTFLGYFFRFVQRIGLYFSIFEIVACSAFCHTYKNNYFLVTTGVLVLWLIPFAIDCMNNGNGQFPFAFFYK